MDTKLTGLTPDILRAAILRQARDTLAREPEELDAGGRLEALSKAVRELLSRGLLQTRQVQCRKKRVYFISLEYLPGRLLESNLLALGILEACREAAASLDWDLSDLLAHEADASLGNAGQGRLAACLLESMATLGIPATGYGLCYEFGLFRQRIQGGRQVVCPAPWRAQGTPWLFPRPDESHVVPLRGRIEHAYDPDGKYDPRWIAAHNLVGIPFDLPIVGFGGETVNSLRLFATRASGEFEHPIGGSGEYLRAVEEKILAGSISRILFPCEEVEDGREIRLLQEYFLVSCALNDLVRQSRRERIPALELGRHAAVQLNGTPTVLAVTELMRILLDEEKLEWVDAWRVTREVMSVTLHTLRTGALESWSLPLLGHELPRHLQIILEINQRFLDDAAATTPGDLERLRCLSMVEESEPKLVRMTHLAIVGCHAVNTVSEQQALQEEEFLAPELHHLMPERFLSITNGVSHRRWLLQANPGLAALVTDAIGPEWITDPDRLEELEPLAADSAFLDRFLACRNTAKVRLADRLAREELPSVDPETLLHVQAQRICGGKRQMLHALALLHDWIRIQEGEEDGGPIRTHLFSGKVTPGDETGAEALRLILALMEGISGEKDRFAVRFFPDYRVSVAECVIPAADVSEQVAAAGAEASGTSNMKFALNGAFTLGSRSGALLEIDREVGEEGIVLFGPNLMEAQVEGFPDPHLLYEREPAVRRVLGCLMGQDPAPWDGAPFQALAAFLGSSRDPFRVLADLPAYLEAREQVWAACADPRDRARRAIRTLARMGRFTADRVIREYATLVWGLDCPSGSGSL